MTDKQYFKDLTSICAPLGLLDDDTYQRLRRWPHGWEQYVGPTGRWAGNDDPIWHNTQVIRARPAPPPEPKIKPVYPWSALPDWVKACAVDADGWAHGFSSRPLEAARAWILNGPGDRARIDHIHKGYIPGTCDWRDTLEHRPEGV